VQRFTLPSAVRLALIGKHADYVLAYRGSLIRAAQSRGHEVHAITGAARAARAAERLRSAGVVLHEIPLDGGGTNPFRDLATQRALRRVLRALRPDAVLCYNPKLVAYGPTAARAAGVPKVAAMVTGLGYAFTGSGLRRSLVRAAATRLYRRALAACDVVFFQNQADRDQLAALGIVDDRTSIRMVAGSGVDLSLFAPAPLPAGTHFLMIARLLRDKGVMEYAQACRALRATHPQATTTLLGGTDDNPTAVPASEIERWRREGVPMVRDAVEDVRPALAACTVFVLPSHREGTSKVMLEAMATGRAVITTDAIGCREPVEPGANGVLVPVGDAEALAAAMRRLADERGVVERFGAESRRIAEQRFDAAVVDRTILDAMGL
jgi:glycosyltransferase involved in cell wall biosynthesis